MKTQRTHSIGALLVLLIAALLLAACGAAEQQAAVGTPDQSTQPTIITGVVTYMDRSALPPNAVVIVDVLQLGADGAPEAVIATQSINTEGQQPPIPFEVPFDATQIDPTRTYVVMARIEVDGVATYASQTGIPVITGGAPLSGLEVVVFPVTGGTTGGELTGTLTGTVTYLERIALDPAAVIEVELQDTTGGTPAVVTSTQVNAEGRQVPIPFELAYDPAAINTAGTYLLYARILVNGVATFASQTGVPVLTAGAPTGNVEIIVSPVAAGAAGGSIRGSVTTPQAPAALEAGAVLQVELREPMLADAPATANVEMPLDGMSFPISFELPYDPAVIAGDRAYVVAARILSGNRLLYATLAPVPVLTAGAPASDIVVPVAPVPDPAGGVLRFTVAGDTPMTWPAGSGAYLGVEIREPMLADAPATAFAQIPLAGLSLPVSFELGYDPARIDPARAYVFDARIIDNNQLTYASDGQGTPVLTQGAPANDVTLTLTHQVIGDAPPAGAITGTITSDQAAPLDPAAVYYVDLREAGTTGDPIVTISAALAGQQFPIPFEIPFDSAGIDPAKSYVIGARILLGEQVLYASQVGVPVLTQGAPTTDVVVNIPAVQ